MDAGYWSRAAYERIRDEFLALTNASGFVDVHAIPVSALNGDSIVDPSAIVTRIESLVDIHTFSDLPAPAQLGLNAIGKVRLKTARPLALDTYAEERATRAFVPVDETTNNTVGAGMIAEKP
jgi:sulfate adenylyltransferase subunit 1 (EFTu-like GTPase family)